jgi:hypothetical protein
MTGRVRKAPILVGTFRKKGTGIAATIVTKTSGLKQDETSRLTLAGEKPYLFPFLHHGDHQIIFFFSRRASGAFRFNGITSVKLAKACAIRLRQLFSTQRKRTFFRLIKGLTEVALSLAFL